MSAKNVNIIIKTAEKQKSETQYRDTLLRKLFEEKTRTIELCNAVTGSNYTEDTEVILCDLDSSLTWRYNDLAFAIDDKLLFMIEHQSTISPNLPLRFLSYVSDVLSLFFVENNELYKNNLYKIPAPKLYVLYNGKNQPKEKYLKLSDAFHLNDGKTSLELTIEIIDVNYNSGHEVLEKSVSLQSYAYLIDQVNKQINQGIKRDKAISLTIDHCIEKGILAEFLKTHYKEVSKMLNLQYDQEAEHRAIHQNGANEKAIEMAKKLLKRGMSPIDIAEDSGLSIETVKQLQQEL